MGGRVRSQRALLAAYHRGRVREPFEGARLSCRARCLLLALTAGILLPARARAQSVPDVPASPWVDPEARPPEASPPPAEAPAPPVEAPPPAPPPVEAPPAPVPANVPTTWGPTRPDENIVAETAPAPPVARPRLSAAVGMGRSFDSVGFTDGVHPVTSFFTVLGIGDGLLGLDLSAFASSAGREERMTDSPIDRLAVDLFGVVRVAAWYRPDDRSFQMRVLHALAAELGLGFERDGHSAAGKPVSGTRFLIHTGARADLPLSPITESTELRLRLAVRRGIGLYTPKLYGNSRSDYTSVTDSAAEVYAALVVVF